MRLIQAIPHIYHQYLLDINAEGQKNIDKMKYRMSSGNACFLKHQYAREGVKKETSAKDMRNMRVGTLVGDDIEHAIELKREALEKDGRLFIQEEVSLYNNAVVGHLDVAFYHNDGTLEVIDEKTIKSWNWKYVFGKDAYDKKGYIFQLICYAHGIMEKYPELEIKNVVLHNLYWRKGDGELKELKINYRKYKNEALQYWEDCFMLEDEKLTPGDDFGCPQSSWECNYCDYSWQCPSPFKKGKR
ncbi:MAG: hypothetical protein HOG49_05575 [Candidatus Scalindua sp.]|jgi:hypothetical protein|nr:hypothetical protein [Candidatus Scalindua sp.]